MASKKLPNRVYKHQDLNPSINPRLHSGPRLGLSPPEYFPSLLCHKFCVSVALWLEEGHKHLLVQLPQEFFPFYVSN